MVTISKELLIAAGYSFNEVSEADEAGTVRTWRKQVLRDGSQEYMIHIRETRAWNPLTLNHFWPSVAFDVQVGKTRQWIKIDLVQWFNESGRFSRITITEMEESIHTMYSLLDGASK